MTHDLNDLYIFAGESNLPLAEKICDYMQVPLKYTYFDRFSNDNLWVQLGESVRGKDVYIVQSFSAPVNDYLVQLLMMVNIARVGDARRVTAVIPHFSYARSDKKDAPRVCITARLIADLIETAGADRVITMTLHSEQVHGFFSIPLDHLTSLSVFLKHFEKYRGTDTTIISPDVGYAKHVVQLAQGLNLPFAVGSKVRLGDRDVRVDAILGSGETAQRAIIIDDEIATGGSVMKTIDAVRKMGTQKFIVAATHGIFSNNAAQRLQEMDDVEEIVVADTVYLPEPVRALPKLHVLSLAEVFGEAIIRNHRGQSMGSLFTFWHDD
ncbi:MAG: ribose-phosphate diphosphokinase [Anaerolineales bacterium]